MSDELEVLSISKSISKAIAMVVYLAQLGFAVPATLAKVPLFKRFGLFVQHAGNLESGYSHFLNENMQLKGIVQAAVAGVKCFAVFDELFRGTNESDALAVSKTTITGLAKFEHDLFLFLRICRI